MSPDRERVIVGISGGVDSAVAALRLQRQGHAVEGLFMKNWDDPDDPGHCTLEPDLAAARAVCEVLGIRLHQADFTAEYWHRVFEHFLAEYAAGRTPNPDVLCNSTIKFRAFLEQALELGADAIATGHYARSADDGDGGRALLRGADPNKDQSYFLHAIPQAALARTRFPLGGLDKATVREHARAAGLPNHDRPDSTGICFIGERRFREFLGRYLPAQPGPMETPEGEAVGEHAGLMYYTLGQRQGLGIGGGHGRSGEPWYVLAKDLARNTLVVGQGHDHPWLFSSGLESEPPSWIAGRAPALPLRCQAQVRYRQRPFECVVDAADGGGLRVRFERAQRAVTPGQSVVLYDGERCLGGAVIASVEAGAGHAPPRAEVAAARA
ncbi:MAG: tRNA 2-thiouridine(34) synthase MnmA [Halofilum sp. (in: g-proteobacteria)]|nr:tRNA 2-thiouridine(34) synthase MnmA [Halofilum sp. (in: g-proteobacteria)]